MDGAGDMSGGPLGVLADVEDGPDIAVGLDQRDRLGTGARRPSMRRRRHRARRARSSWPMVRHWRTRSSRSVSSSSTNTTGRPRSTSQPSQLANTGRCWIEIAPADVPGREVRDRAGVDERRAGGDVACDRREVERVRGERGRCRRGGCAAPVELRQLREVGRGRTRAQSGRLPDELVLVGDGQQRVRRPLAPDGGRTSDRRGRGAERAGAVGGVHGQVVGQVRISVCRARNSWRASPSRRSLRAGRSDRRAPDHQRSAGEQRHRLAGIDEQVGEVVGRVARRRDGLAGSRHRRARRSRPDRAPVRRLETGSCRGEERRAVGRERRGCPTRSRHGSGCRLSSAIANPARRQCGAAHREAGRVDHHRCAIPETHDVRGVAEALVHDAHDVHAIGRHLRRSSKNGLNIGFP